MPVSAQQPDIVFHHLTQKDGLSYNIVNCFLKDSRGMLWVGTYNGLSRYDGAHFYVFRKNRDKTSLPNNTVHKLAEDSKGNIWGATDEGIFCYLQQQNIFRTYHVPARQEWPAVFNILCDQQGVIWASSNSGLIRFNKAADSFELAPTLLAGKNPYVKAYINKNGLVESTDGKGIWLACDDGLLYYNKTAKHYVSSGDSLNNPLFTPDNTSALCATRYGHYWYFNNREKQLVSFDPDNKKVKQIIRCKEFQNIPYAATVFEDNDHVLWVCSWGYEIYRLDYLHNNSIQKISHHQNDESSVAGDFFWAAMHEEDGTLWLGTVAGISRCNTSQLFYKVHHFADSLFSNGNPVFAFIAENKNDASWWMTTAKKKLLHYEPATSSLTSYDYNNIPVNKQGQHPGNIGRMLFMKERIYLFSNYGAWVKEGRAGFKPLQLPSLPDSVVLKDGALMNDSMLYCTDTKKIYRWKPGDDKVTVIDYPSTFRPNGIKPVMTFLTPGNDGKLWMLSWYDCISYVKGDQLVPVKFSLPGKNGGNGFYTAMTLDKNGSLWMCKKGDGLFNYNPASGRYDQFTQYDGLVMDHVMGVAADSTGKIWTAAYNQFSVYNPLLSSFYNFTLPLSENNYAYTNIMVALANGHVIGNVAGDIVEFFPGKLKTYSANTQPLVSSVNTGGNEKLLPGTATIALKPDENSFQVKFGLLADHEASPYDMLYIMEGAEKNWTVAGNNFEASYNSLSPGHYTFKVKAVAKDKGWQTKETVLHIHIAAPFYKTWWFLGLVAAACAIAVYGFYRYRLFQQEQLLQLENKAQMLEKEKTVVLYESLKQQLNPHFLFNSLTSLSGLIETDQQLAGNFLEQMSKTYRYILKSSDSETVPLKDEIAFVKLYIQLQQTRFKEGLAVTIDIPEEYHHYRIAPVTLQNMIENAIKHNVIDAGAPLVVEMFVEEEYLVVKNNLQRKNVVETSNKQGLENLRSLYRYLTQRPIVIEETATEYAIKIPLI